MRCKKCGKALSDTMTVCPVCKTQVSLHNNAMNRQPTTTAARSSRCLRCGKALASGESQCPVCGYAPALKAAPVTAQVKAHHRQKQESIPAPSAAKPKSRKIVLITLSVLAAAVALAVGLTLFGTGKNNGEIPAAGGGIDTENHRTVNEKISAAFSQGDDNTAAYKEKIGNALDDLAKQGRINNVRYNDENCMYEFTYADGSEGGAALMPFSDLKKGIEKNYVVKSSDGRAEETNNRLNIDPGEYRYNKVPKLKIMYGLGYDDILEEIHERSNAWESNGIDVDTDEDCTVRDFSEGLTGYDYIDIEEHGSYYGDTPVICLEEIVTEDNLKEYSNDVNKKNIVEVTVKGDDSGNSYYWIKPSFFAEHYTNKELSGSIVFLGCCNGYRNDKLVSEINKAGAEAVIGYNESVYTEYDFHVQDAFVYSLMCGDTVNEALDYAKSVWGESDYEWYELYGSGSDNESDNAEPKIYGDRDLVFVKLEKVVKQTERPEPQPTDDTNEEVPELVETIVSWTEGTQDFNWIDSFEMFNGYMDKEGYENNEIWFQDVTGDGEPEMIVGGYGMYLSQGESRIFEIYDKNGVVASGDQLTTMWTSSSAYGHDAFTLQAYQDSNGQLLFADGSQMGFTSGGSEDSGAYELTQYRFEGGYSKQQLAYFGYYEDSGSFEPCIFGGSQVSEAQLKSSINEFFSDKTPLKAEYKTIKLSDYKNMSQSERTQALTESYNAAAYTEDNTVTAPLSWLIGEMAS